MKVHLTKYLKVNRDISGGDNGEATPVPIPNTEVKLSSADGTWTARSWKSRSSPGNIKRTTVSTVVLFILPGAKDKAALYLLAFDK